MVIFGTFLNDLIIQCGGEGDFMCIFTHQVSLTLFASMGVNLAPLPFSLYLRHGFGSESEDVKAIVELMSLTGLFWRCSDK